MARPHRIVACASWVWCVGCGTPPATQVTESRAFESRVQRLVEPSRAPRDERRFPRNGPAPTRVHPEIRWERTGERAHIALSQRYARIVTWNVKGRFHEASRELAARWGADIVLLNDQKRHEDHEVWVAEKNPTFHWFGDDYSVVAFGARLELMEPLTHSEYRAPIVHLLWHYGADEFHLFTLHAQTPSGGPERHQMFLREADLIVDAIGSVSGHWHTIIAGDFNARSPQDGETEYVHSVARLLNAGYVDTYAAANPGTFAATKLDGGNTGHRIDYVFVSADMRPAIIGAGIDMQVSYPEYSDHRPVWADLDLGRLFGHGSGS